MKRRFCVVANYSGKLVVYKADSEEHAQDSARRLERRRNVTSVKVGVLVGRVPSTQVPRWPT